MRINNSQGRFTGATFRYEFQILTDGGSVVDTRAVDGGDGTTTFAYPNDLNRDTPYRWQARAILGSAVGPWSTPARFLTQRENRTPNPTSGRLPLPGYGESVVHEIAARHPDFLRNSCQEHGGAEPAPGTWQRRFDHCRLPPCRVGAASREDVDDTGARALPRRSDRQGVAVDGDRSRLERRQPDQSLEQSRLAMSFKTRDTENLARRQREADIGNTGTDEMPDLQDRRRPGPDCRRRSCESLDDRAPCHAAEDGIVAHLGDMAVEHLPAIALDLVWRSDLLDQVQRLVRASQADH